MPGGEHGGAVIECVQVFHMGARELFADVGVAARGRDVPAVAGRGEGGVRDM